jgi:hypothetical protein
MTDRGLLSMRCWHIWIRGRTHKRCVLCKQRKGI